MKKILSALLAMIMVFSLAACSGNSGSAATDATPAATSAGKADSPAATGEVYKVKLGFPTMQAFPNETEVEKVQNFINAHLRDDLGITDFELDLQFISLFDYATNMNMDLASGATWDIVYTMGDLPTAVTNGYFTDRIIALCKQFPKIGIRISIEGMQATNDAIRRIPDGWNRGYETLKTLVEMGHPDVGFGMTVQDMNCEDLVPLYKLSDEMGMEFATATLHNSFYFRKTDNKIDDKYHVAQNFEALINELLQSKSPKKWFRAYFNHGLINYIYGNKRLLPCDMSKDAFFIDPFCDVIPCNGMAKKAVMGNLKESPDWDTLWNSEQAKTVRAQTKQCDRNCWMIGSVSPAMHKYIWVPGWWVVKHKFLKGGKYSLSENAFIPEAQKK